MLPCICGTPKKLANTSDASKRNKLVPSTHDFDLNLKSKVVQKGNQKTKKNPGLLFHFHMLNLFKSCSNLGFDQDSNGHKNSKKIQKKEKQKHAVFLCHIVSIQVDKQGLDIIKLEKSCIYPLNLNSVL